MPILVAKTAVQRATLGVWAGVVEAALVALREDPAAHPR